LKLPQLPLLLLRSCPDMLTDRNCSMNLFDTAFKALKTMSALSSRTAAKTDAAKKENPSSEGSTEFRKNPRPDVSAGIPHYNQGMILERRGSKGEAISCYRLALRAAPNYFEAHANLARLLCEAENWDEAISHCEAAIKLRPNSAPVHNNCATALYAKGKWAEAVQHYTCALRVLPDDAVVYENLLNVLTHHPELEPTESFKTARLLLAQLADRNFTMGFQLLKDGKTVEALNCWRGAVRFDPNWAEVLNNLAWILATHPVPEFRNGKEATELAKRAVTLAGDQSPRYLDTLAAAHAECGRFLDAKRAVEKALAIVRVSGPLELAEKLPQRLKLYQSAQPLRDPLLVAAPQAMPDMAEIERPPTLPE
jgi:tetratricopeptide (TPR) repeat protein